MQEIKQFFIRILQFKILFLILIILVFISFLISISIKTNEKISDFFINLSASFVTLIGTLFIVDVLLEKGRKKEFKIVHSTAKDDLFFLGNELIHYIRESLEVPLPPEEERRGKIESHEKDVQEFNKSMVIYLSANSENLKLKLKDEKILQSLKINLTQLRSDITDYINLYKEIIPSSLLGKFLLLRQSFFKLHKNFGLILTLKEQKFKGWQFVENIFLNMFSENLKDYLEKLKGFIDSLYGWINEI